MDGVRPAVACRNSCIPVDPGESWRIDRNLRASVWWTTTQALLHWSETNGVRDRVGSGWALLVAEK
jgi:hypothetical protein